MKPNIINRIASLTRVCRVLTVAVWLLTAAALHASAQQRTLRIELTDGNAIVVPYADITAVTFTDGNMVVGTCGDQGYATFCLALEPELDEQHIRQFDGCRRHGDMLV